jgi:hypothetical protein
MSISPIRLAVVFCILGVALPASAADIRAQLTPDLIHNHCQVAGVGSETEGTFMLPSGRVIGTVLCNESDLSAPKIAASKQHGDDDQGRYHDDDDDDDERDDLDSSSAERSLNAQS